MEIKIKKTIIMEFTEDEAKEILRDFKDMSNLQSNIITNSSIQLYRKLKESLN